GREEPAPLLASGGAIWLTNVIAFALWYWEFDRGGPVARARARRELPDFQFVQMENPSLAHPDWEPHFLDCLSLQLDMPEPTRSSIRGRKVGSMYSTQV